MRHEDHAEDLFFISATVRDAALGDPRGATTQIGPVASRGEYDKVVMCFEEGR